MTKEKRIIQFDKDLGVEAYEFEGIVQPFAPHFHEHFVVGLVEGGERELRCSEKTFSIHKNQLLIFNPHQSHGCSDSSSRPFHFRGLNLPVPLLQKFAAEMKGAEIPVRFSQIVIDDEDLSADFRKLHHSLMRQEGGLEKEELFVWLFSELIQRYARITASPASVCRQEVFQAVCFIKNHFSHPITLEEICRRVGLSRSTLLRAFLKEQGVSPNTYLQSIRLSEAKKMLSEGIAPSEVAVACGFFDHSHLCAAFRRFLGLSPAAYQKCVNLERKKDNHEKK